MHVKSIDIFNNQKFISTWMWCLKFKKRLCALAISPDAVLHPFKCRKFTRDNKPRCCSNASVEQRLEESELDITLTPVLCVISVHQLQATRFKHLHFRTAEVWRLHCEPRLVYLHGGGSARWERSIKHHANYPGCTGIRRELWATLAEFAASSIHLMALLLWPQKEPLQVASMAWIIEERLKALIWPKLNLRTSCNVLQTAEQLGGVRDQGPKHSR